MAAEFEIQQTLVLENRSLFALVGAVTRGMVHTGMTARLADDDQAFEEPVHGVEVLDPDGAGPAGSGPALLFSYSREEKLERWRAIDWAGRRIRLSW